MLARVLLLSGINGPVWPCYGARTESRFMLTIRFYLCTLAIMSMSYKELI
jgi:hypothetical protein